MIDRAQRHGGDFNAEELPPGASVDRSLSIEILRQCKIACTAWKQLKELLLKIYEKPPDPGQGMIDAQTECFAHIQSILVCAGIVSSILWPTPSANKRTAAQVEVSEARGTRLARRFRVSRKSVLKDRSARNLVVHVDEQFDDLFADGHPSQVRDFSLVFDEPTSWQPPRGVSVPRAYIFPGDVVLWFGERANLGDIAEELCQLAARTPIGMKSVRRSSSGQTESDGTLRGS